MAPAVECVTFSGECAKRVLLFSFVCIALVVFIDRDQTWLSVMTKS